SRSFSPLRMGFQANFARMKSTVRKDSVIQKMSPKDGSTRLVSSMGVRGRCGYGTSAGPGRSASLFQHHQQAHHHGEEGGAFHQRGGEDHVGAQVIGGFRLAGHGLHGVATDAADADTGTEGGETGTEGGDAITG